MSSLTNLVQSDDLSGRSSPGGTRIPRVSQKPPTGGPAAGMPRQILRRSSGSAPNSRCVSPSPKPATPRIVSKKPMSPMLMRQTMGSPGPAKSLGSPGIIRRPSPGPSLIKPASPTPHRAVQRSPISPCDRPPSPCIAKLKKSPSKIAKSDSTNSQTPTKRVPTPMVQRKDLGSQKSQSVDIEIINKDTSGLIEINTAADENVEAELDEEISMITANDISNKENRISTLAFKPKGNAQILTSEIIDLDNPGIHIPMTVASDETVQRIQTVLKNANNNSESETHAENLEIRSARPTFNRNLQRQFAVIEDRGVDLETFKLENKLKGHSRRHSTGILLSTSVDRLIASEGGKKRCITPDIERCTTPIHTSIHGYSDTNMNRCAGIRTSTVSNTPTTVTVSSAHSTLTRTSVSMSLPILSNTHCIQNNNNIKNLLSPSSLSDEIPRNAGEELYIPKFDDVGTFFSGQNGYPVILNDALELGGQGLCENYDEIRSPMSPTVDGLLSPVSSNDSPEDDHMHFFHNGEDKTKSQSCPNLSTNYHFSMPALLTEPLIDPDDVYEKYPPIRHLDVNKLHHYREEQLREYYDYLLKQQAEWEENGLLINNTDSGQEVQRISVVTQLPGLLDSSSNAECMRRVVPKIREVLHVAQPEMQMAACSAFLQILQEEKVPLQNYTQTFLKSILTSIDNRDQDVANVWMDTLLDVIDLLPKDVIKRDIMPLAISKGQLSQSVQSRLSCCRILGKIATKFDPFIIKKDILPVVQSLCQDVDYEVRGCMCRQLDSVARGLGLEQTKSAILPELVELTNDEESYVRLAGLDTVVNILSLLDDDTCTQTIVPLVCKFCQQALASEDNTLPTVAKHLGRLCHGLSVNLNDDQKHWFVAYYHKLCKHGASEAAKLKEEKEMSPSKPITPFPMFGDMFEEEDLAMETRRNAGFNFPAMALFVGPKQFKMELFSSFHSLCRDCHHNVRKTIASGFHEVAKLLANNSCILLSEFKNLLLDDSTEVLNGLIEHLPESLEVLIKSASLSTSENKAHVHTDLIDAILASEGVVFASNNWRLQEEFMKQLSHMTKCFSSDLIYQKFMPLLFRKVLMAKALPVRLAAGRTILILMRQNRKQEQREEICERLIDDLCHSDSCHRRSLFIDLAHMVLELYSRTFFKQNFYESVLDLTSDKVPNVRLKLCPLLPKLKSLIKLPVDRNRLQQLEQGVRKILVNESDRDVIEAIEKAVKSVDAVQIPLDSLSNKRGSYSEENLDQKKEEEEKYLLELEEQDRLEEEARSAKAEKKNSSKKDGSGSSTKIPAPKRGSKIPASGSSLKDKTSSASSTRSERSSSFTDTKVSKSTSKELDSPGKRVVAGTSSTRKTSANNVSSNASISVNKTRRTSISNGAIAEVSKKSSATNSLPSRKLSVESITSNSSNSSKKK